MSKTDEVEVDARCFADGGYATAKPGFWYGRQLSTRLGTLMTLLALAMPARAQVVLGTVRDSAGNPVPLAHVFGLDSIAAFVVSVGTVTDPAGHYLLRLGARTPYLGARRLGYSPERPRSLDWTGLDTLHVDLVLHAFPFMLPMVYAGSDACLRLDSLPAQSEVRQLWEGAVATIAAREALLSSYRFTEFVTGTQGWWVRHGNGTGWDSSRTIDRTYFRQPPRLPLPANILSAPLATTRVSFLHREWRTQITLPQDRLLLHPQFFQRFCFDDQVTAVGEEMVEVRFRERGRGKNEVAGVGTMTFKHGPGPSRVDWEYFFRGKKVGQSEQVFELVEVNGAMFPMMTRQSYGAYRPQTPQKGSMHGTEASSRLRYAGFTPAS